MKKFLVVISLMVLAVSCAPARHGQAPPTPPTPAGAPTPPHP